MQDVLFSRVVGNGLRPNLGSNELEKWDYRRFGFLSSVYNLGVVQLGLRGFLTAGDIARDTIAIHFSCVVSAVVKRRSWRDCGCFGNRVERRHARWGGLELHSGKRLWIIHAGLNRQRNGNHLYGTDCGADRGPSHSLSQIRHG
jgi:hypothetical protein